VCCLLLCVSLWIFEDVWNSARKDCTAMHTIIDLMLASSKDSGFQGEADVMMIRSQPMCPVSLDLALLICIAI
jgi:hypothetical protein